mgnify:CR=1 FL=1
MMKDVQPQLTRLNELYEEKREFFEDVYNHPDKYYKEHHKTDE